MHFFTKYVRPVPKEIPDEFEPSITETAGYIPADKLIRKFIKAGLRLDSFRAQGGYEFGFDEEVPDEYFDPTRSVGYDIVDAARDLRDAKDRLKASYKAQKDALETSRLAKDGKGSEGSTPPDEPILEDEK